MKCKLSEKCEFGNLCKYATRHDSLTVLGCSSFKAKKLMTNEEYIRSCSTEELAKLIYKIAVTDVLMDRFFTAEIVNAEIVNEHIGIKEAETWLKEIHEPLKNDKK